MALTIKHKLDGSFYEQGDTQGVLIPVSLPKCVLTPSVPSSVGLSSINESTAFSFSNSSLGFGSLSGKRLYVPEGLYIVYFPGYELSGYNSFKYINVVSFNSSNVKYKDARVYNSDSDQWARDQGAVLIEVPSGGYLLFGVYIAGSNALQVVNIDSIIVVPMQQRVPYLVANKGALGSGGAFQFDEDGNGYTENYSTDEVKVGFWIDGKPIYKKTYVFTGNLGTTYSTIVIDANFIPSLYYIKKIEGMTRRSTDNNMWPIVWYQQQNGSEQHIGVSESDGLIFQGVQHSSFTSTFTVTVTYTKLTD